MEKQLHACRKHVPHSLRYGYDSARRLTAQADSLGRTDVYLFKGEAGLSRLLEHRRADGTIVAYLHGWNGQLFCITDPLGRKSNQLHDAQGNITRTVEPDLSTTSRNYNDAGLLASSRDETGALTRYGYDDYKRRTEITLPDGATEHYRYPDPKEQPLICDNPIEIEDAKGGIKRIEYNNAGQPTRLTDCSGKSTSWRYDRWGDITEETNAQGQSVRYERDKLGRITATHLPSIDGQGQTERTSYDRQGNPIRIEPVEGNEQAAIQIAYDLWNRPIQISQGGLSRQVQWDRAGRPAVIINENGARYTFDWDVMDKLVRETGFDGRVQRYQRDAAGEIIESTDGTGAANDPVTRYRRDALGRLIERTLPATKASEQQRHQFDLDKAGRLLAASVYLLVGSGGLEQIQSKVTFERDALGRITGETQSVYDVQITDPDPKPNPKPEHQHVIEHTLDALGQRIASILQDVGEIQYLRYGSGHVHGITHNGNSLIDIERDDLHREIKRIWHGPQEQDTQPDTQLQQGRWYDPPGRLQGIELQGLPLQSLPQNLLLLIGQITRRQYHFDALGQITAIQMAEQLLRYGYDAARRLTAQTDSLRPDEVQRWPVDPAGNRLPSNTPNPQEQRETWAEMVHRRWQDPEFNLLGQGTTPRQQGPVEQWNDNRIGYDDNSALRYDAPGNRTEQQTQYPDGRCSRHLLYYDGGNQLLTRDDNAITPY